MLIFSYIVDKSLESLYTGLVGTRLRTGRMSTLAGKGPAVKIWPMRTVARGPEDTPKGATANSPQARPGESWDTGRRLARCESSNPA